MPYKIWLILFSYLSSTIDTISLFRHSVTLANAVERQKNTHISYTNTYIGHSTLLNSSYTTVTLYSYTLFIVLHTLNMTLACCILLSFIKSMFVCMNSLDLENQQRAFLAAVSFFPEYHAIIQGFPV